jgi:hypothetical protein
MRSINVPAGGATGAIEIVWITFPATSTFEGGDKRSDDPLKIRTFSNSTPVGCADGAGGAVAAAVIDRATVPLSASTKRRIIHTSRLATRDFAHDRHPEGRKEHDPARPFRPSGSDPKWAT